MLLLTPETKVLLAVAPVDFRKQIDGLVALCSRFGQQPNNGTYYAFINRSKTMIKILGYEGKGYWLAVKRLSRGRYRHWPQSSTELSKLVAHELRQILNNPIADCSRL